MGKNLSIKQKVLFTTVVFLTLVCALAFGHEQITLRVDTTEREALLYLPSDYNAAHKYPLIFAFHAYSRDMHVAAERFDCEKYWPEAIVVYPQGLPTIIPIVDPTTARNGWQEKNGDQSDRDLRFFDALLEYFKSHYSIDSQKIFATGFSNGGVFTYLLWAARGEELAAIAPIASILMSKDDRPKLEPKPVFHVGGKNDPLIKYAWQEEMVGFIKTLNQCETTGIAAGSFQTRYVSALGTDLVTYFDEGGHELPAAAIPRIIEFFKAQELSAWKK